MVIVDKWNNAMGNVSGWMMMILWLLLYHPQISGIGECGCLLYLWKCIFHPWSISRSSTLFYLVDSNCLVSMIHPKFL